MVGVPGDQTLRQEMVRVFILVLVLKGLLIAVYPIHSWDHCSAIILYIHGFIALPLPFKFMGPVLYYYPIQSWGTTFFYSNQYSTGKHALINVISDEKKNWEKKNIEKY